MTRILIVDDEPDLLDVEAQILSKKYGFEIETAGSGMEALEKFRSSNFDAIISDVSMPEMDGLSLLKAVRNLDQNIPFIIFTIKGREEVAIEALNQGASFYVQKEETPHVAFAELAHKTIKSVDLVRAERNLRIQRDLAISCANAKSMREILKHCANAVTSASGLDASAFYLMDEGSLNLSFSEGFSARYSEPAIQGELTPHLCSVIKENEAVFADEEEIKATRMGLHEQERVLSEAIIPISHHGRKVGLVHLASHTHGRILNQSFQEYVTDVIIQIAGHIADRQAEEALYESERKLDALIRNLPGIVYIGGFDPDRTMEFVSNGCEILTGYQADELIHNRVISYGLLIHPADAPKIHEVISRAISRHVQFRIQYRVLTKEGKYRWVSEQGTGVYDDTGNPMGIEGFIIDITRQKILDDQVKTTQNRLNLLFAHMNAGCAIFSQNGSGSEYHLVDMNSAAERIENRKKEQLIGKAVSEYFPGDTADPIRDAFSSIVTDYQPRSLKQIPYETSLGRIWIDIYLFISKTHRREVFVIYSDITDRVEDEERIITSLHEKETLLKEVHHRVKNNLQIISGILKLQSYRTTDQDAQNIIQECRNQVYSMASIHELLYNSKDIGKIRVSDYVEQLLDHLKQEYGAATSRITFIPDIDQNIVLDIERCIPCGLILNELITNAVKYAFEPGCVGEVRVSFRMLDQMFEMRVTDNGKGFPKDFDVSKTKTLGTELIVRLTRQLKGKIHLGPGPGTDVLVVFPDKNAGGITGNE